MMMQQRLLRGSFFTVAWLVLSQLAWSQEWTRFRGPNGTGISEATNIPTAWTEADYNWKVELPGGGHSCPVLWGDKIFLTCANDETCERMALCLSAADGSVLWSRGYASTLHPKHTFNSYASPTPAVDEERVYFTWSAPEDYVLLALDHEGNEVWKRTLGPYQSQHSTGASPIVYEDMVIINNDQDGPSSLIAVDRKTGETRWQVERRTAVVAYSTPCVYQPPGAAPELIFNSKSHGITAVDPHDGKTIWEAADVFDKRSVSSPIVAGGVVFGSCGSGGGGNYVVAVRPGSAAQPSAELAYKIDKAAPYVPTPLAKGDLVFLWGDQGVVTCIDPATGTEHWRERVGGNFFGSPVCAGDHLYCISTEGEVVVVAAAPTYQLVSRNPLGEMSHSTPAIAGGKIYFRTFKHLISLGK